eukprot:scaffold1238_cov143-Amphora_coffeaeformis.AAC.5
MGMTWWFVGVGLPVSCPFAHGSCSVIQAGGEFEAMVDTRTNKSRKGELDGEVNHWPRRFSY